MAEQVSPSGPATRTEDRRGGSPLCAIRSKKFERPFSSSTTTLPQISPSPLTFLKEPIGHPNWVHEVKHDGFRGILYVDRDQAWLVSRKGKKFRQFDPLLKQVTMLLISSG